MLRAFIIKQHQPRSVHFYEIYTNNLDPDQSPQNAASDQDVLCLFIQCFIQIFKIIIILIIKKNNGNYHRQSLNTEMDKTDLIKMRNSI